MKRMFAGTIVAVLVQAAAWAAEPSCTLTIDAARLAPGKQAKLAVTVTGGAASRAPEIAPIDGLDIRPQGSTSSGAATVHQYRVIAKKAGQYRIGPVSVDVDGIRVTSNDVALEVAKEAPPAVVSALPAGRTAGSSAGLADRIYLAYEVPKEKFYVNERIPIAVKLYSDWFDLENIVIDTIVSNDFIAEPFVKAGSTVTPSGPVRYAVLEYRANLVAPTPGTLTVEPIKAVFALAKRRPLPDGKLPDLLNDNERFYLDLIGPGESRELTIMTKPVSLEILPLPREGRPDAFRGAVGSFSFDAAVTPATVRLDDDLTVRLTVTGEGNYATVNTIAVPRADGIKLYDPQARKEPGRFVLEQTARLTSPDVREFPAITFTFFDPTAGEYRSITKGPFPVTVVGAPKKAAAPALKERPPESRPGPQPPPKKKEDELIALKPSLGWLARFDASFYATPLARSVELFPLALLIVAVIIRRRMTFLETDREYAAWFRMSRRSGADIARAERLARRGKVKVFYDYIFTFMQEYLGARLFVPAGGITERTVEQVLEDKLTDPSILVSIRAIFAACYRARFAAVALSDQDMQETLAEVKKVIGYFDEITYLLTR